MPVPTIVELHDQVFDFLANRAKHTPDFRFTLRKSDKESRLSRGYYFYGNDYYLAVSFWSGTDWKNRTPNIIFVIVPGENKAYLEISVGDSQQKEEFVNKFITPAIDLYAGGRKIYKNLDGTDHLDALDKFLNNEKLVIDQIVAENQDFFGDLDNENRIGFIPEKQFSLRLQKALAIKEKLHEDAIRLSRVALRSFDIINFSGINQLSVDGLPENAQWIFFTGTNGTGKTSILRALSLAIMPEQEDIFDIEDPGHFEISAGVTAGGQLINLHTSAQTLLNPPPLKTIGFAAYGASRLIIGDHRVQKSITPKLLKRRQSAGYSIFHTDGILFDFAHEMAVLYNSSNDEAISLERLNIIVETLIECVDPLANILIEDIDRGRNEKPRINCLFIEKDSDGNQFIPVTFDQLSTGLKSLIAMFGDMIVRLFRQQPDIYDIAGLRGIVLIDEIDLHFHPEQQRNLVEILTTSFPKIQFIVTTHSPIPLLGAPKNSVILRTKRNVKEGVVVERIDTFIDFSELLPNTILTSPIFGLKSVVPEAHKQGETIRTEKSWKEIKLNDAINDELKEIYNRLSNDQ